MKIINITYIFASVGQGKKKLYKAVETTPRKGSQLQNLNRTASLKYNDPPNRTPALFYTVQIERTRSFDLGGYSKIPDFSDIFSEKIEKKCKIPSVITFDSLGPFARDFRCPHTNN